MAKDRGFKELKGKTIKSVNTTAINQVLLHCEDGTVFEINVESWWHSLPIIELTRQSPLVSNHDEPIRTSPSH